MIMCVFWRGVGMGLSLIDKRLEALFFLPVSLKLAR